MTKYYTLSVKEDGTLTEIEENEYYENLQYELERLEHFICSLGEDISAIRRYLHMKDEHYHDI